MIINEGEEQYLKLLGDILGKGVHKDAARENMPGTTSLFGYQMRFDLGKGFPLITTKRIKFKHIVTELLWFLKGDTNIKYLVDNGCNIWNEDAYNYYRKIIKKYNLITEESEGYSFEQFVETIKEQGAVEIVGLPDYTYKIGDCGKQYGWLWRNWESGKYIDGQNFNVDIIDQLDELIKGLKSNPLGRRHIISAWNPATLDDMALNACHSFVQFNCRPIPWEVKLDLAKRNPNIEMENLHITEAAAGCKEFGIVPQYYLDCQMYQRSADSILGVPYNIASYALLTEMLANICSMVPGDFIHTSGDVHIYDNHIEAAKEQVNRDPRQFPRLILDGFDIDKDLITLSSGHLTAFINSLLLNNDFRLEGYDPHPAIVAKLSTGLR